MNNLRIFFHLLPLLSVVGLQAQSTFKLDNQQNKHIDNSNLECIYTYTVNAPLKADSTKNQQSAYITILQANSSVSKFWDWHSFKKDSIIFSSDTVLTSDEIYRLNSKYYLKVENLFTPVVFKNYLKQKYTVTDELLFDSYIYTEKDANIGWELKDDTLTVCGYRCNKAVATFRGKEWTAWYAPEIPISDGPWKLCGLPGLILKAQDSSGIHTFNAITIRNSDRPVYIENNVTRMKINKKKYDKEKTEFESEDVEDILDVSGFDLKGAKTIILDGKRLSLNRNAVYCPLEE